MRVFHIRHCFHDLDKIFLYLIFSKEKTSEIHRKNSRHHSKATTINNYIDMIIDWECARLTKPDKPLNVRETLYKYYKELEVEIEPLLLKLGL